jgi:hypothetical protein
MRFTPRNVFSCLAAALAAAVAAGCGGASDVPPSGVFPSSGVVSNLAAKNVYVIQDPLSGTGQVLAFVAGSNGTATPATTLTAPTGMVITAVATDSSGGLYVAGYLPPNSAPVIEVYPAGASGPATPARTINVPNLYSPTAMTVDSAGSLYTVDPDDGEVFVYSSTATGAATPTRTISGSLTQLDASEGVAVDSSGNIYVASALFSGNTATGAVYVFSSTANGNVAPTRIITNPNGLFLGEAVDSIGDLYLTLDSINTPPTGSIVEYAPGASGAATPMRMIAGAATGLLTAGGVSVDGAGDIFVSDQAANASGSGFTYALDEFAPSASGNVAPVDSFTSSSWTNAVPGIATH